MKNHRIVSIPRNMKDLLRVLYMDRSVYFAPLDKVMPTKFFLGELWRDHGAIEKHLGNFFKVEKKSEYFNRQQRRIGASVFRAKQEAKIFLTTRDSHLQGVLRAHPMHGTFFN